MKLKVDEQADALYLRLDDSEIVESEEVSPGVVLDFAPAQIAADLRCDAAGGESATTSAGAKRAS